MLRGPARVCIIAVLLVLLVAPAAVFAQSGHPLPPSVLMTQSDEFAAVRAHYERMTREQITAAGYHIEPVCVISPAGGMGFHAANPTLWSAQFWSGRPDPHKPPLLLLDGNSRVVGVEWEAAGVLVQPELFGQRFPLLPGHPGVAMTHYMLHAYFRPNNQVLFSVFDPQLTCPPGSTGQ